MPNAVYDFMPANARRKGGDACLCFSCENTRLHDKARHNAGARLKEHLEQLKESGQPLEPWQSGLMADLVAALCQGSKGDFVRCLTCGGLDSRLADRPAACTDGDCDKCGFKRLWQGASGLRAALVEAAAPITDLKSKTVSQLRDELVTRNLPTEGLKAVLLKRLGDALASDAPTVLPSADARAPPQVVRADVNAVWNKRVYWSSYVKQVAAVRPKAAADEDEAYNAKNKVRTETVVVNKCGSIIEFLDALALVADKHVYHRGILDRQTRAALECVQSLALHMH